MDSYNAKVQCHKKVPPPDKSFKIHPMQVLDSMQSYLRDASKSVCCIALVQRTREM